MTMRAPRTLLGRLLAWAIGAFVLVWIGFALIGFATGQHEADELTDGHLASVAALLLSQTSNQFDEVREPLVGIDGGGSSMRDHDYQRSMSVVVWDAQGRVISRTGDAPAPPFEVGEGFANLSLGTPASEWRTFTRWKHDRSRRVMVLLSMAERDDLAWDIGTQVIEPGWWFLPVLTLVLGLAIRRGLEPLNALSQQVHALDVQRATPLAPAERPHELAALADAINTLVARYHAALGREQQLASELAHELRTPLASLSLHAGALRGAMAEPERQESLQRIEHDALRAGQLLTELLALARASRAELAEAAAPLDLAALARRVVAEYGQAALDSGHELGVAAPAAWTIDGHALLLEMALRNLIDNALAHTPRGSRVEVQLDAAAGWLQVCDDGAHQPPDAPPAATGTHALGLGLGHRVVEKIAAIHGGSFAAVPPPPGFGTCYRFRFAAASA
ncbi:sensor histidine kinase N-terminal domain-containing protein [Aquincola sp. S2]|uniref:histidine kinase n=1 Tax=Pseudaquabacterium terrae TaxID=2732868 RepID=A0ABX2ETM3_9BURK|nr:histidine kinase dimerization/phospho-acceptor domain-containing protein [Aquabacterium terrae]NRF71894.1 sensor histidine kinase N-terminal domain-containing protein [Aquabacterium terrae]